MADQTTGKVPRVRFKAYAEPWADEKIGDVLAEKRRPIVLEDDRRYELITVKRRNEGVVSRGHLLGRDILVKNYAQLKAGDFVISKRQVVHGATGIVPPALDGAIVSNEYLTAVDGERLLTEFLTIVASLPAMRRKFFLSSYGVDIEKLFFDAIDWMKRDVTLPGVQEQSRIAQFFQRVDQLIALHQRQHEKLLTLKRSLLQRMFPQPGTLIPEIRFKGFSEVWKERSLGEMASFFKGKGLSKSEIDPSAQEPCIHYGQLFTEYSEVISVVVSRAKGGDNLFRSIANDVLMPTSDVTPRGLAKASAINESGIIIGGDIMVIRADKKLLLGPFLSRFIRHMEGRILQMVSGSTVFHLYSSSMEKFRITYPSIPEQLKICSHFLALDELILKHAAQLKKLQEIKFACLNKMFV
ncbi:MAG: restriction endonuclease subunit S [Burkholderiales bacterium]|nr:restriction endonuclease subunit S [Burkholderiales bacterium]